jgi:hypothetical protein
MHHQFYSLKHISPLWEIMCNLSQNYPDWRWGQVLFNSVSRWNQVISGMILDREELDPYYNDGNIDNCVRFILDFTQQKQG